jgi:hypothetical protein
VDGPGEKKNKKKKEEVIAKEGGTPGRECVAAPFLGSF